MDIRADDKELRRLGREMFSGAWQYFANTIFWAFLILVIFKWWQGDFERDDTDGKSVRSGMELRTDFGTGCQYLESKGGGITPRLKSDGRQVCR